MYNGWASLLATSRDGWTTRRKDSERPLKINSGDGLPALEQDLREGAMLSRVSLRVIPPLSLVSCLLFSRCSSPVLPAGWINYSMHLNGLSSSEFPDWQDVNDEFTETRAVRVSGSAAASSRFIYIWILSTLNDLLKVPVHKQAPSSSLTTSLTSYLRDGLLLSIKMKSKHIFETSSVARIA